MIYCVLLFVSALAFSSGLGTTTTLMMSLKAGDHVICMSDVYGGKKKVCMTVCFYHFLYTFRVNLYSVITWMLRNSLLETVGIWKLSDCNLNWTHSRLVCKQTLNHLAKLVSLAKWLSVCLRIKWLWVQVPSQWVYIFYFFSEIIS